MRGTRFVITGLKSGGLYKFRVIAFNTAGNSEPGEVPEALEVKDRSGEFAGHLISSAVVLLFNSKSTAFSKALDHLSEAPNECCY